MRQEQLREHEKPEGFDARQKARFLRDVYDEITKRLKEVRDGLIRENRGTDGQLGVRPARWNGGMPDGFTFKCLGMMFYVEFGVTKSPDTDNLDGLVTYGVSRPRCFDRCPVDGETAEQAQLREEQQRDAAERRYNCERNERCDHREDKPLLSLRVSRYGVIKDVPGIKGSWISGQEERIFNLHHQVLEQIWKDALDWFNETFAV